MNYTGIKTALLTLTRAVSGIGRVYGEEQYADDWAAYLRLHTIANPHDSTVDVICTAWWARESSPSEFTREEEGGPIAQQDTDTWKLVLIYGFDADDTYPSESDFHALVDAIRLKFQMSDLSTFPAAVQEIGPLSLNLAGLYIFGGTLCHRAELSLQLRQRSTSIT